MTGQQAIKQNIWKTVNANRKKHREASLRDALEMEAIHALKEQRVPIFSGRNFHAVVCKDGETRWLLRPESVALLRGFELPQGLNGKRYCRACGGDLPAGTEQASFDFQWDAAGKMQEGFLHPHDCTMVLGI